MHFVHCNLSMDLFFNIVLVLCFTTTVYAQGDTPKEEFVSGSNAAKRKLVDWFLNQWKEGSGDIHEWSYHLHRMVVALHLSGDGFFNHKNKEAQQVVKELKFRIMSSLTSERVPRSHEMALSIHALLVTCSDPWDFYGFDLVSRLRREVEEGGRGSPFALLALCNARDAMTQRDAQRAADAFESKDRPFTTDYQAMSLQALACFQFRNGLSVNLAGMAAMEQELKHRQFRNGTISNLRTTALALQALISTQSHLQDLNLESAVKVILEAQEEDGSFGSLLNSYYVMPVLKGGSFLNITNTHCLLPVADRVRSSASTLQASTPKRSIYVQYSILIQRKDNKDHKKKTRNLYVPDGSSFYDVIEIVNILDSNQKVQYNVEDGKPYVSSINGLEDDQETGLYWYIYRGPRVGQAVLLEESPADVKISEYEELILWYGQEKIYT